MRCRHEPDKPLPDSEKSAGESEICRGCRLIGSGAGVVRAAGDDPCFVKDISAMFQVAVVMFLLLVGLACGYGVREKFYERFRSAVMCGASGGRD
jgi:hypothetical protein